MISFDNSDNSSDLDHNRNLLGKPLIPCSTEPLTGFFRDGLCRTCSDDTGSHTVCAVMTEEFLQFTVKAGKDLVTPRPEFNYSVLVTGDRCCLCAARWLEDMSSGFAQLVVL